MLEKITLKLVEEKKADQEIIRNQGKIRYLILEEKYHYEFNHRALSEEGEKRVGWYHYQCLLHGSFRNRYPLKTIIDNRR